MRTRATVLAVTLTSATLAVGATADATTRYQVDSTVDASVRNCPPSSTGCGYVIGHLRAGSTFDATYRPSSDSNSWAYGYGYGNYSNCGWVQNGNLTAGSGTPQTLCSSSGTSLYYGTLNDGDYVLYRYTTENGMWAMVRDPFPSWGAPADHGFFVRRNCLAPESAPIATR
jgi:hypothetical protein